MCLWDCKNVNNCSELRQVSIYCFFRSNFSIIYFLDEDKLQFNLCFQIIYSFEFWLLVCFTTYSLHGSKFLTPFCTTELAKMFLRLCCTAHHMEMSPMGR